MPLLPRFDAAKQKLEDEQNIAKILGARTRTGAGATSGGDPRRLRGLPAIGRSVSGAIHGTTPEAAMLAKENARRP